MSNVVDISNALNAELNRPPVRKPVEPLPIGLHYDIPGPRYYSRAVGQVNKSGLDKFHKAPKLYKAWVEGLEKETAALRFGRAFHCAILEPDRFAREYAAEPDFGNCTYKANKERRNAWRDEHAGFEVIDAVDMVTITGMREAVMAHPLAGKMIRDGRSEVTAVWTDPETGLPCRCRADYYVAGLGMVVDVKSCEDASEDGFIRSIAQYRYFVQDALYRAGFNAVGARFDHFVMLAVEKQYPYLVATHSLDSEAVARGYTSTRRDIDRLAECVRKNEWPGYPERITSLRLPPWAD